MQRTIRRLTRSESTPVRRAPPWRCHLTDPLSAAAAERHGLVVIHDDSEYDLITAVTDEPTEWVVPQGSVPWSKLPDRQRGRTRWPPPQRAGRPSWA